MASLPYWLPALAAGKKRKRRRRTANKNQNYLNDYVQQNYIQKLQK